MTVKVTKELSERIKQLNAEIHELQEEMDNTVQEWNENGANWEFNNPYFQKEMKISKLIHEKSEELMNLTHQNIKEEGEE